MNETVLAWRSRTSASEAKRPAEGWLKLSALSHVLVLSALAAAVVALVVLLGLGGARYYATPLKDRPRQPLHQVLKPSGSVGRTLGIAGVIVMGGTLAYVARKKVKAMRSWGSLQTWLEVHIFCGILGPTLVTFHTAFKFGGAISVAYWSMLLVVASGFVGRYLYVRVPRNLRGAELDRKALESKAAELRAVLADSTMPLDLVLKVEEFERSVVPPDGERRRLSGLVLGDVRTRFGLRRLRGEIRATGVSTDLLAEACAVAAERAFLLRRIAYLELTRRLLALWHVFHRPLVWVLGVVALLHVGVAIYFGYALGGT